MPDQGYWNNAPFEFLKPTLLALSIFSSPEMIALAWTDDPSAARGARPSASGMARHALQPLPRQSATSAGEET